MQFLNEYHRQLHLRSKQMEKERSERPPRSPQVLIDQVNLLQTRSQAARSSNARSSSSSAGQDKKG